MKNGASTVEKSGSSSKSGTQSPQVPRQTHLRERAPKELKRDLHRCRSLTLTAGLVTAAKGGTDPNGGTGGADKARAALTQRCDAPASASRRGTGRNTLDPGAITPRGPAARVLLPRTPGWPSSWTGQEGPGVGAPRTVDAGLASQSEGLGRVGGSARQGNALTC